MFVARLVWLVSGTQPIPPLPTRQILPGRTQQPAKRDQAQAKLFYAAAMLHHHSQGNLIAIFNSSNKFRHKICEGVIQGQTPVGGEFGNGRGPTCPPALTMAGMPLLPTAPGHRQDIRRALLDLILSARTAVAPAAITGAGYSGKKVLETKGAMPALPRRFAGITPPTHDGLRRWSGRAARSRWPENVVVGITANG